MCLLRSTRHALIAVTIIYGHTQIDAKIALTDLKGFSDCMNPAYMYLSPAVGALYETYAKNLTLFGNQTSEAVIFLHELFSVPQGTLKIDVTKNPTAIGRYLDPVDIGAIIGLVVQHKNNAADERTMVRTIENILKKVIIRKQFEIKKAITDDLHTTIAKDNKRYQELEHALIKLYKKEERADIKNALAAISRTWNKDTENVILNKINTQAQKTYFIQLKNIHRKLIQNHTFLDQEQRTCDIASPNLKDSMGAFTHAIACSISEEGTVYLRNNTINLLLAFLWQKAETIDDIKDTFNIIAKSLAISPEKLCTWHQQEPYTLKTYEELKTKIESEIARLPLEEIIFMRYACRIYEPTITASQDAINVRQNLQCPYAKTYCQSFIHQLQTTKDQNQQATLESLIASFAPDWSDVNDMDPKIIYCRFLMQQAQTASERLALVLDVCQGHITMNGMVSYYLDAINNIYLSLPKDFHVQRLFFDHMINYMVHNPSSNEFATHVKQNCLEWIQDASDEATKTAVMHVLLTNRLFDTSTIEGLESLDTPHFIISTAKTIQTDAYKLELIMLVPVMGASKNDAERQIINEFYRWAIAALPTITDESAQIAIIHKMLHSPMPEDSTLQTIRNGYYSWATNVLSDLQDDDKKADLIIDTLSQCSSNAYPNTKHEMSLLATMINKTLPSICQESALIKIITALINQAPCEHESYKNISVKLYDWLKEKLPVIGNEEQKIALINRLLDKITATKLYDQHTLNIFLRTIEKALQSIHDATYKSQIMQSIVNRPVPAQEPFKTSYKAMYQWIERNMPDIKDPHTQQKLNDQIGANRKKYNL